MKLRTAVLFGGTGFIGSHLAAHLLRERRVDHVVLADLRPPSPAVRALGDSVSYAATDVRQRLDPAHIATEAQLVVNLAAVHREPGHAAAEYFETNVRGAENVCAYATAIGCTRQVFTSSIAVYGPTETPKDERSLPVPLSPYGGSKLVAEQISQGWQQAHPSTRRLVIVRPGVVYGAREGGNVTRLVRAVARGYFVFTGNHHVRKAGGYVKELCSTITWALDRVETGPSHTLLYNFSSDPTPRLDELVAAVANVAGRRVRQVSVPFLPVLAASHLAHAASRVLGVEQPLHPVRARKIVRSNFVVPRALKELGYTPRYSLVTALEDWKRETPDDWR